MSLTDSQVELIRYLEIHKRFRVRNGRLPEGMNYYGVEDYLLERGRWFVPMPLPEGTTPGLPKQCFHNSLALARVRKLRYIEGYALGVFPVLHAWNADARGRVIDVTWTGGRARAPLGTAYFGVEFPLAQVRRALKDESTVLDDWRQGFPLLREPRTKGALTRHEDRRYSPTQEEHPAQGQEGESADQIKPP